MDLLILSAFYKKNQVKQMKFSGSGVFYILATYFFFLNKYLIHDYNTIL